LSRICTLSFSAALIPVDRDAQHQRAFKLDPKSIDSKNLIQISHGEGRGYNPHLLPTKIDMLLVYREFYSYLRFSVAKLQSKSVNSLLPSTFCMSDRMKEIRLLLDVCSYWAFTRYDRRTDQTDRPVGPTGRSDDRNV